MPNQHLIKLRRIGFIFVPFLLVFGLGKMVLDRGVIAGPLSPYQLTDSGLSSVGGYSEVPGALGLDQQMKPPAMLARQDYQDVYDQAAGLLSQGVHFRTQEIQIPIEYNGQTGYVNLLASSTITMALQNYADFNDGDLFYDFCSDYTQVDEQGYCPQDAERRNIRNKLIRARELYAFLSLAQPDDVIINQGSVRELGVLGVLTATRELANIHMIFGNEFLVDAVDYRFSAGAPPSADLIIQQEIGQLTQALEQYRLATDVFVHALNADYGGPGGIYLADYYTDREIELFSIVVEKYVEALDELALRYRILGQDQQAWDLYTQASVDLYLKVPAIADKAQSLNIDFYANGGQRLISNLARIRALATAQRDGLNPFGFTTDYVPVHTYAELYNLVQTEFLRDAEEDELAAFQSQREFDQNATAMLGEFANLRLNYDAQLLEICGTDVETCEGGLMLQNLDRLEQADTRIDLAQQRLNDIPQKIAIEQQRSGTIINLILENGNQIAAWDYTIALWSSLSISRGVTIGYPPSVSLSASISYNPFSPLIAHLTKLKDLLQSAERAQIEGANSEAVIRNLLLEQADLMIELELTVQEYNQVVDERSHLWEKYHNLRDLKAFAEDDLLMSYLNKPSYRILRETQTLEAVRSHDLAAQFAYLTAKALEYEYLTPVPFLNDIFKARSSDDIDNFMIALEQWRLALGDPGQLNPYPYRISIAQDVLGYTDENLDPNGTMTPSQLAELRYQLFQQFIQTHLVGNTLEFHFSTSVLNSSIFSQNIWNNRIAGVGMPLASSKGVGVNLLTRQFGNLGTPEIILIHSGQTSYRNVNDEIVEYTVGPAVLVGYALPPGFINKGTTAVILSSVNNNNQGVSNSALFNLSVAASNWTLRIDLTSPFNDELDLSQLEDLEILLDSTGIALPGFEVEALQDSQALINSMDK